MMSYTNNPSGGQQRGELEAVLTGSNQPVTAQPGANSAENTS